LVPAELVEDQIRELLLYFQVLHQLAAAMFLAALVHQAVVAEVDIGVAQAALVILLLCLHPKAIAAVLRMFPALQVFVVVAEAAVQEP
jgi:hypothetical protein